MKRKVIIVLMVMLLVFSGIGIAGYKHFFKDNKEEIVVGKNQNVIVAQISKINGNEITYTIANEVDLSEIGSGNKENFATKENRDSQDDNKDTTGSENFDKSQRMPEGEMPSDMGNRSMPEGEMPSDMGNRNMPEGEMPGGMEQGAMSAESDKSEDSSSKAENGNVDKGKEDVQRNKIMYTLTGEEETTLIPVGTTVTTQLGTTTTFSRLAAGDMIKLLVEKDKDGEAVIVGIWMI